MKDLLSLCLLFVFLQVSAFAISDPDLEKGWAHYEKNEYKDALTYFNKATNGPEKAMAYLAASLTHYQLKDKKNGALAYTSFYETAEIKDPYLLALWSAHTRKMNETELALVERILAETTNSELRALAHQSLGGHFYSSNDHKKAKEYFAQVGNIKEWQILGEFENISHSGFDKDFGALGHPENSHEFTNKRGIKVKWFSIPYTHVRNWLDFSYHFYTDNVIQYAQTFCKTQAAQRVQFRLGVSGTVKVWVNDQLAFSESDFRNNDLDSYVFNVNLQDGFNRILVQIGSSDEEDANMLLRITDLKGNPIVGMSYQAEPQAYEKNMPIAAEVLQNPTEAFFQSQIEQAPDQIINYLIVGQLYFLRLGEINKSKRLHHQGLEYFPNSLDLHSQLRLIYSLDGDATSASLYEESMKRVAPNEYFAISEAFEEALEKEEFAEAEKKLEELKGLYGKSEEYYDYQVQLYAKKNLNEELYQTIESAYEAFPNQYHFVRMKYALESEVKKSGRAHKILSKYLKNNYRDQALIDLSEVYSSNDNVTAGIETYRKLVEINPNAVGYWSNLASMYHRMRMYRKVEDCINECFQVAPYIDSYYKKMARAYKEMQEEENAISYFEKAIKLNPYDYSAREELADLRKDKSAFTYFEEVDAYEAFENSPNAEAYPDDHSIYVLDEVQKVVYAGGGSEKMVILLVKVFNNTGVDQWKELQIPMEGNQGGYVDKAEVIKKDGSRIEASRSGTHVVFSNLEPGDAVHLAYRLRNYYSSKLYEHFWDSHHFSSFVPLLHSRFSLLVPKGTDFQKKTVNFELEPTVKQLETNELYIWERHNVAPKKYEPYMPSLVEVGEVLHISSFDNWQYINDWYRDLSASKAESGYEVEQVANQLFGEKAGLTDKEKVESIYDYIVDNIRYRSVPFLQSGLIPQKATHVISHGQGDCKDVSTLFVALCKTQNIDAELVLVNTRDYGIEPMALPGIEFNHCIAKVKLEGEPHYLELTAENMPMGAGSTSLRNVFSLDISHEAGKKSEAKVLNYTKRVPNVTHRNTAVTFSNDSMLIQSKNIKSGNGAFSMRNTYENEGKERRFTIMQEAITNGNVYPNTQLTELQFIKNLDNNAKDIHYSYTYIAPNVFNDIAGLRIFKMPWTDPIATTPDFLAKEAREFPIELWAYTKIDTLSETITIEIPAGYKLSETPPDESYDLPVASFQLTHKMQDGKLVSKRDLIYKRDRIMPEEYTAFRQFLNNVIKSDARQLALTKL